MTSVKYNFIAFGCLMLFEDKHIHNSFLKYRPTQIYFIITKLFFLSFYPSFALHFETFNVYLISRISL